MKQKNLFIGLISLVVLMIWLPGSAIDVAPHFVGNASTDSVYVTFSVIDTTYYPVLVTPDSVNVLQCDPDGDHIDSLLINSPRLKQIKPGCYRGAFRGSDGSGTQGTYTIYVMVRVGGAWRGAAGTGYEVIDDKMSAYLAYLDATVSSRSTLSPSDNIGINWDDIINPNAGVAFTNTQFAQVNNLAPAAIVATSFATGSITADAIANSAITNAKLATAAISSNTFASGAITSSVLATDCITSSKLAANSITTSEFAQNAADKIWSSSTRTLTDYLWTQAERDTVLARLLSAVQAQTYWNCFDGLVERIWWDSTQLIDTTRSGPDSLLRSSYFSYDEDSNCTATRTRLW